MRTRAFSRLLGLPEEERNGVFIAENAHRSGSPTQDLQGKRSTAQAPSLPLLAYGFLLTGLGTALLGPILPLLALATSQVIDPS